MSNNVRTTRQPVDIGNWLRGLGLDRYEPAFLENAIDFDVLPDLTESDLENLGFPLGDRKRLLKAIRTMLADTRGAISNDVRRESTAGQPRLAVAERRHLTVMICDLVGSTALSARLDPEDMCTVIDAFQAACARIVSSYDGFIADFRGDGILAYFGYPHAHEDDAERTVRASLDLVASVARLKTQAAEPLAVRTGIATGLVVIGEAELGEHAIVGDAPNVAARLQALAEPGEIVVATSTRRLLGNLFQLRDLGRHHIKGFSEPVEAWVVEAVSAPASRFEAVRTAGLMDLIGRENEINFLLQRRHLAWKGEGQIVLISGEPGIGKSRLAAALAERSRGESCTYLRYQCSPYHANSVLYPFITHLERAAKFKTDDASEQRLDKLEALLALDAPRLRAVGPLLASLLSVPFGQRYPALALNPTQQRRSTLAALLERFEDLARLRPILLLFEDMHWADATSLELLDLAVLRMRQLPVLALFTFRPQYDPPWLGLPNVQTLRLGPLNSKAAEGMITQLTGGRRLPSEVMKQIIGKTDGNPLFIEELTKTVMEVGILIEEGEDYRVDGPLPPLAIPATLQDSLMSRLDRLASVKEIGQIGAAIGREFSYHLLHALVPRDEAALRGALAQLEQAELVFRRGDPPEAVYTFKHALVRDAAYESLLKSRRHQLHAQIAHTLEKSFADVGGSQPEIIAHHFTEAGLLAQASDYWLKAGNLALSRSANAEAVKHLRKGIELTQSMSPSPARARQELKFYLALGPAVAATEGHATPETLRVFSHARDLMGDGGGSVTEQMTVLWGVHLAYAMAGQHRDAHDTAQQCLALASKHEHPGMLAMAHRFIGQTLFFMGAFIDARFHLEQALRFCAANEDPSYRRFGADDQVTALSALSRTLWILGHPQQAVEAAERALGHARTLGLAFSTAFALDGAAFLGVLGADPQTAAARANEVMDHSIEHGLADYEQRARFIQGALLAQSGDPQRGVELMRAAIAAIERSNSLNRRTLYLGHYAAAHASLGQLDTALDLIEQAIQVAERTDERFFEAELYRLRGDMLSRLGMGSEAEAELRRALTIAQQQQARWWELRAATGLAKHCHALGRDMQASSLLEPAFGWFAEGFETADLREAKTLLDRLGDVSAPQVQAGPG
jgi:class 3 adenylate cyclase/tetratricopeptide (TPR) repeat protein